MGVRDRYNAKKKSNINEDDNDSVKVSAGGVRDRYAKKQKINELGLDTLSDELNTMNSTINSMMGGWQTAETMANTKASVQSMVDRLSGNEDFIKQHSGFDISPLLGEYSKILEGWDERTALYGHYANSDAFNKAVKNAKLEKQFEGLSYGDVQARMRRYAPDSDEYNYLKNYTGYSSKEDFDKAMEEMAKAVNPIEEKAQEYEAEIKQIESNKQTAVSRSRGAGGIAEFMDEKIDKKSKEYDDYLTSQGYDRETLDERLDYQRELEKAKNRYLLDVGVADEYKHLEGKDDFAKYSQYDASVNKGKDIMNDFLTYDHEYDYINNIGDVRNINKTMAVMAGSADSGYYSDGYDQLRENEVAYYNYLSYWDRQNGTKNAKKFLKEMKPALQKRVSDRNAVNREALLENPVIATAYSLTSPIATVAGGIGNIASSVIETVSGSGYNAYSPLREISNANTHARGVVAGNIAEATEGFEVFGQNIPSFLYQTGGSMLDSTVGMLTTGGASVVLMGANAYQQKAKELTEQGFDEGTVQANAIMSGALEVAFEKIGFDNLMKMKDADSIRNVLKSAFKSQGIVEGCEELGTAGGNILADIMFQGKDSQYIKMYNDLLERGYDEKYASGKVALAITSELGWSTVGGYLSGVGMGGSMSAMQYGANKATGADLRAGEQISGVFDLANNPEMAQAYEAYTRYANEGITAENITDAQLGNLYNTATADAQQGFVSASKDLSKAKKTIEKQKAIRENEYWSDGIRNRATEKLDKAIAKQTEAQQKRVANAEVLEKIGGINTAVSGTKIQKAVEKKKEEADREKRSKEIAELSSGVEVSAVAETGKAIDIKGIKVDKGETTIVTRDGDIALDKVELSDRDAALIRFAKGADSQAEAQLFLDTYDENINTDLEAYENDFTLVNAYAKSGGFSEDYILEHKGSLSAEQVSNIYKETIIKQTLKKEADLAKLISNTANNAPYKGYIDDSIIDYKNKSTEGKVNWNKLNSRQKQSVEFLKVFATKAGMNLVFEGYSDTMNGAFNIVDNTIHVSLNAGITETHLTDTIIPTASHEITHWMEEKSSELYNKLATMVLDALSADGISREARIRAEIARLDKSHPDKKHDERDAVNEIVAKACEDMLAMSKEGRKLFESMTEEEQKTFVGKIKEIIANLKKWIDEFLSSYKSDSEEAKALRNYKEKLVEISKVWDEMFVRSIEVNQAMEKADIFGNLKNGISADGTTIVGKNKLQMSDKTYRDGGRDFLIKWLDGQKDISKADKQNIIEQTDRVAAIMRAIDEGGEIPEYSRWANLEVVKDENGDKVLSVIVKNGDYAMNIDFSQVCKKRVALNAVLNKMVQAGDLNVITLTETDVADLNAIIKSHDFEIACALCFVDSKRYRVGSWAESFCEGSDEKKSGKKVHKYGFNEMVRSLIPKGSGINVDEFNFTNRDIKNQPTENLLSEADDSQLDFSLIDSIIENNDAKSAQHRYAKAIKENPDIRKILNHSEIISSIGLDTIRLESPKLYGLINGHQGTAKPKFSHDVVAYGNDVLKASNFTPERAKMVGGVRCQSFSDFMAVMVVDYAQFISELAAKKLTAHSYTKEPLFVKLFGLTGMKINMSLVPKTINMTPEQQEKFAILKDESVSKKSKAYKTAYEEYMKLTENAGLDENGNYIWEDETFPYDIAMEIVVDKRYSKNCGTIAVGISNNHIKKLLADPTISMVIPYHKSGLNHEVAMMRDIALYRDYTEFQNTRDKKTGKKLEKGQADFDFYGDLYGVDGKEGTHNPKQTAENYKKWCYENNYIPKFDEFMLDENYYKLLIDFRVYDVDGTYVEQQPVQTIYPDNAEFEDLILNGVTDKNGKVYGGLKQQQANTDRLDSESQQIVDEYKQMLKEKHGYQFQFSMKQKAEETHDLIAFHNITEKKLLDALVHGKLIMPSIAVSNMGMTDFGDISMVFGKDTIDPDRDASNKLYGSDAWTPTQTSMKKNPKFDDSKTTNVVNSIKKAIGNNWSEVFDYNTVKFKKAIESADGSIYDAFAENIGVQASYAINNGIISAIPKTKNGKIDKEALKDSLDAKLNKDEVWRAYKVWLENISNDIITSYNKASARDILNNMKAQPDSAKTFKLSVSGELIVPAIPYSSVQDLRNNKHRLSSDADNHAKIVGADFLTWADNTSKSTGVPVEQVVKAINESFESRYNIPSITKAFNDRGIALTDVEAISLQALYKTAVELPTRYFEAKPGRTVGFDEVATAIIPNTTSAELRSVLDKNNISYTEYEAGNDNARLKALNSLEGVKFSDKGYVAYDSTALLKESTIDTYLKDYASKSSPNYAQAYITYMSPYSFLELTTSSAISKYNIERESKRFERDRFEEATRFQPIHLTINHATGEVTGHEGRHRMVALEREGIHDVPVLLFDSSNKNDKKTLNNLKLVGQFNEYRDAVVGEAIPLSYANRDLIIEKFGTKNSMQKMGEKYGWKQTLQYSDKDGRKSLSDYQFEINQLTDKIRELEKGEEFGLVSKAFAEEDVESAIKKYNEWLEKSGYSKIKEKRDSLQKERDALKKQLEDDYKNTELAKEREGIEKSGLSEADYFRKQAVKEFGYTPFFYDAGYITPNGKMLNFSGEKGQHFGSRGKDHRAIGIIYANVEGSHAMIKFMGEGNIRIMAESPGIDISSVTAPTPEQYSTIRKFAREYANKEYFNIDFTNADGQTVANYEYDGKVSPDRVINDIKYYFENGTTREQSVVSQFRYSDKNSSSVYDIVGEKNRLLKENEAFKDEVERLKEALKLEKQVTHGNHFNENQLTAVAKHLLKISNSEYSGKSLIAELKDIYSYIAQSKELTWEDLFSKCYAVAKDMVADAKPQVEIDNGYKQILKDIKETRIYLDEHQKAEAEYLFGKHWNRAFFGKVIIANDAKSSLDQKWQEWAEIYPEWFDADVNPNDQVSRLIEIVNDMRDASEIVTEYDTEEQARWLANEIYNQYWNVSSIKTTADKYDKQMQMLKWKHRQAMDKLRSEYKERAEQKAKSAKLLEQMYYGKKLLEKDKEIARQKLADDMYYGKIIHNLQVKREQEADRLKAYGKERLDSFKERAEQKARIQSITGNARILNEMLVNNSKDKHIPDAMKPVVEELLQAIDFSSKRLLEGGEATQNDIALDKVFGHLKDMITDEVKEVGGVLDEMYGSGIDELTRELVKSVDDSMKDIEGNVFTLNEMSVEDLKKLDTIIKVMKQAVNRVNKFHIAQYNAGVKALGVRSTSEIDTRKKLFKDNKKHFEKLKTHVFWNNLNPYYAFKHLGEASQKIFTALQDGQDKLAFLSREVIDFAKGAYTEAEYKKWKDTFFDFEIPKQDGSTAKFSMNVPQIMSLYCLVKQEDARKHILFGDENGEGKGITIVETEKTEAVRRNIRLTEANLKAILDKLNETDKVGRAKEVADKLQEYMGTRGAELGNEISMARWGIKSFGIKDYFPIKVSDGSVPKKNDTPGIESTSMLEILNMSFTKSRNHFAKQSVEIGDIMDVFANHMSNMVRYNAMALPILDMYKWINCRGEDAFGNEFSLQTSIRDTFGDHAWSYFNTFLKDISGGTKKSTRDKLAVKFFKNAKVAKVAGNLRVALLQFTSFVRAGAVIDNKYLMKALGHKPKIKMAEEKCGIAQWKSQGYYDTDITRGLSEQIKHTTGVKDKIVDWSLKGAEWGDKITWGYLWTACELEIRDKRKDLTVGSDEFYKAINERLRDVIYRTQVVDSVLTRSQMMRSPDTWDKVLTMFGSESALSFNMAMDVFVGYELDKRSMGKKAAKDKNRKYQRKAITAFIATNVVTTILQSVFDAFRDYDEEDKDEEYWTKLMLTNFLSNTSVLNKLPYISNISSILQGFTPSRVDTDWMVSAVKAGKEMYKLFTGEGSTEKAIKNALKVISDSTGIAAYNVYRDIQSMYELFDD